MSTPVTADNNSDTLVMPASSLPASLGTPLLVARFKSRPEDFVVVEDLGFDCSGQGEHLWLQIRKTGLSTTEVVNRLARATGLRAADISFSGLKDKYGVCTQWFSLHSPGREVTGLAAIESEQLCIEQHTRNHRKLRRGSHRHNRFCIRLRDLCVSEHAGMSQQAAMQDLAQRIERIRASGVPNYFGEQRFGHNNLADAQAWFQGKRRPQGRQQRSMWLSAARSAIFNAVLAQRVSQGSWQQYLPGDVMNLDGSGSVFVPDSADELLQQRLQALDIHPTGPLWGQGELATTGQTQALELAVAAQYPFFCSGLQNHGLKQERRSLRLPVKALDCRRLAAGCESGAQALADPGSRIQALELEFTLPSGSYATAVLHELCAYSGAL